MFVYAFYCGLTLNSHPQQAPCEREKSLGVLSSVMLGVKILVAKNTYVRFELQLPFSVSMGVLPAGW
jgi:hypothetical protein